MMQQVRHQYEAEQLRKARDKSNSVSTVDSLYQCTNAPCSSIVEAWVFPLSASVANFGWPSAL